MDAVTPETTTHYLFKSNKNYVRTIFEQIEWKDYVSNMGAPNVGGKSLVVKAYSETKNKLKIKIRQSYNCHKFTPMG